MTYILTRAAAGRKLTYAEMDANLTNLNSGKAETSVTDAQGVQIGNAVAISNANALAISMIETNYMPRADLAANHGSSLWTFLQSGSGSVPRTGEDKLRDSVNVRDKGAMGDSTDQTVAISQCAAFSTVRVPAGVYVIDTINISTSVTFACEPGVIFRRKAGSDISQAGYLSMTGMFVINTNGVDLKFTGSPTFDGNYTQQTTTEPGGCAVLIKPPTTIGTDPISLYIENGKFINGTSEYLMIRGDDVNRRYRVDVTLVNCNFTAGMYGKGKSDPSTPTALGYLPTYVHILDYVVLRTYDFKASFLRPLSLGNYAACAVWGSFAGADYTTSGGASILMYGRTEIDTCGRAAWKYNDATNFTTNNGLGAIDGYGNVDEVFVEHIYAKNTQYSAVRAKCSCRVYTVLHADLQSCWRGLEVSPSSTGPGRTVVQVGKVLARDGTIPQIYFVGSATNDQIYSVDIDSAYCFGTQTNPEALVNSGNVMLGNTAKASVRALSVIGSPSNGLTISDVDRAYIGEFIANNNSGNAVQVRSTTNSIFSLDKFDIRNQGSQGIWILNGVASVTARGGTIDTCVDYGIFNQSTGTIYVQNVTASNISGLSRGFYNAGGYATMLSNTANVGVTTPLFPVTAVTLREDHNSWNPRKVWGSFTTTTVGTWGPGDEVWYSTPTAGSAPGRVCVTGGSPGTWKDMASLAA